MLGGIGERFPSQAAEKMEFWRQKEEAEMRHRVQQKRHDALARARRQEKLLKMKEDRRVRQESVRAARGITEGRAPPSTKASMASRSFMTQGTEEG